jgi:hypothetical protein
MFVRLKLGLRTFSIVWRTVKTVPFVKIITFVSVWTDMRRLVVALGDVKEQIPLQQKFPEDIRIQLSEFPVVPFTIWYANAVVLLVELVNWLGCATHTRRPSKNMADNINIFAQFHDVYMLVLNVYLFHI